MKTCDFNLTQMDKELLYATGMSASMSFIAAKYPRFFFVFFFDFLVGIFFFDF